MWAVRCEWKGACRVGSVSSILAGVSGLTQKRLLFCVVLFWIVHFFLSSLELWQVMQNNRRIIEERVEFMENELLCISGNSYFVLGYFAWCAERKIKRVLKTKVSLSWPHDLPLTSKKTRSLGALLTFYITYCRQWIQGNRLIGLRPSVGLEDSMLLKMYAFHSKNDHIKESIRRWLYSSFVYLVQRNQLGEPKTGAKQSYYKSKPYAQPHEKYFFSLVALHSSVRKH